MDPAAAWLSPEWPPSTDQLANVARDTHWELEQVAYDLAHRPHVLTRQRMDKVAGDLEVLARLFRNYEEGPQ